MALLLVAFVAVHATPVPAFSSSRNVIRRLDPLFLEKYAAPPRPLPEPASEVQPTNVDAAALLDEDVGEAISNLARLFEPDAAVTGDVGAGRTSADRPASGIQTQTVDDERFSDLFGMRDPDLPVVAPRGRPAEGRRGAGIEIAQRPEQPNRAQATGDTAGGDAVSVPTVPSRRVQPAPATDVVIKEFASEEFDRFEVDVLEEWMQAHPGDLPVGVKVHLNFVPEFLTAAVPMVSNGRAFELFLMYNQSLRELHIVMVEGERSVYLIDRGFRAESRSLRSGTVRRLDGEIVAVNSQRGAAGGVRAREFYSIFLSWWEAAKHDVTR
jgi:hypothetical protein